MSGHPAQTWSEVTSAFREDPLLVAGAAVVVLVLLLGIAAWIRLRRRTPGEKFLRTLGGADAVTVLMHPNPDPDAMACALAVAALADEAGAGATIQHPGQIRHQENRAFRTVLELESEAISSDEELADGEVVLVDHNEPRGFEGCEAVDPYAVIDHHPGEGRGAEFTDVRTDYGACASIIAEYLEDLGAEPGEDSDPELTMELATGLIYGIMSDTDHLTRGCSPAEFDASAYLYPAVDEDALDRIANPPVDAAVLDTVATAIRERDVRGPFAVSDVGELSNVDAVPQAADELLRLEGVTAVVVLGDDDETLHLSGRSRDDRVHMGDVLDAVVSDIPMSGAGGHARMGGGQVSLIHMEGLRPDSGVTREEITERLFDAMAGDI